MKFWERYDLRVDFEGVLESGSKNFSSQILLSSTDNAQFIEHDHSPGGVSSPSRLRENTCSKCYV